MTDKLLQYKNMADASKKIEYWLNTFTSPINTRGGCIVIGSIGIGKTSMVKSLVMHKYQVLYLTPSTMPIKKNVNDFFHDHILSLNLEDTFCGIKRKRLIIIDEIENLSFRQKSCLLKVLAWIYPSKKKNRLPYSIENNIPIIFIGRHTHIKALQTVLKHCLQIKINPPSLLEQFTMVKRFFKENQIVSHSAGINVLLDFCHNDIRHLMLMCNEFLHFDKKVFSRTGAIHFLRQYGKVNMQNGVIWSALDILSGNIALNEAYNIYQQDKYLLPLMIHENYPLLFHNEGNITALIDKITNIIMTFDHYDTYMYKYQYWSLQELCGLIICGGVSILISEFCKRKTEFSIQDISFTKHLNRTSLITVRTKKLKKLILATKIYDLDGLYYLKKLVFRTNDIKKYDKYWSSKYGLDKELLEILFKIDIIPSSKK